MDNNSSAEPAEIEDTVDLFDVLLTLAENVRLLVLGPLLVGALVFGLTSLLPQEFESTAVLRAEANVANYMTTATVLAASLKNLGYLKNLTEEEAEEARVKLEKHVKTHASNDKLVTLTVTAISPEAAQSMASEILTHTFAGSRPRDAELKRLETKKSLLEQQASELTATSRTTRRLLAESSSSQNLGALAESITSISIALIKIQEDIHDVEKSMLGLTSEDLLQTPTLSKKPLSSKKGLAAILATLGAGFVLVVFVLLRQSLRTSNTLEQHRLRLDALKRRYGLG